MQGWDAVGIQGGGSLPRGESWAEGGDDHAERPAPSLPHRRIEELTQELAASKQLVEMLSAEKHNLQQRLEEPLAVGGQVGVQAWGDPSPAPWEEQLSSLSPSRAVARAVPHPAWQSQVFACLCRGAGGDRGAGRTRWEVSVERPPACAVLLRVSVLPAPVCHLNPGS